MNGKRSFTVGAPQPTILTKKNIKILNWEEKRAEKSETLKEELIKIMSKEGVSIKKEEILAIHRVPSKKRGPRPVIVKFLTSSKRQEVITKRKQVKDKLLMIDHLTTRNLDLIAKLRENECIHSAWYFNCNIYAIDVHGERYKFDIGNEAVEKKLKYIESVGRRRGGHS